MWPAAVAGSSYPCNADERTTAVNTLLAQASLQASEDAALPARSPRSHWWHRMPATSAPAPRRRPPADACATSLCTASQYWVRLTTSPLTGIALEAAAAFATPIGKVPVEVDTCATRAERQECITVDDYPHLPEHSIEVQLPSCDACWPTTGPVSRWRSGQPRRSGFATS